MVEETNEETKISEDDDIGYARLYRLKKLIIDELKTAEHPLTSLELADRPLVKTEVAHVWPHETASARNAKVSDVCGAMWRAKRLDKRPIEHEIRGTRARHAYCLPEAFPSYGTGEVSRNTPKAPQNVKMKGQPREITLEFANMIISVKMRSDSRD